MDDHLKQLLLLGREHYQKREYDKAEYLLRQVVAKTDRYADVFDMLGVIAHSRGDFALAERYFEKAVGLNPNYTEAQLNLMVTYNDLGKYDAARQIYALIRNRGAGGAAQADPFAKGKIANMHAQTAQAYQDAGNGRRSDHRAREGGGAVPTLLRSQDQAGGVAAGQRKRGTSAGAVRGGNRGQSALRAGARAARCAGC